MSYNNFKPHLISAKIQTELALETTLCAWCNTEFEGEVKQGGTVSVIESAKPTIKTYTGADLESEYIDTAEGILKITEAKYFDFRVKDIDAAMTKSSLFDQHTEDAKRGLAEARDKFVGGLAIGAGKVVASTEVSTDAGACALLDDAILTLRQNNVPTKIPICADVPWWYYYKVLKYLIDLDTNNSQFLKTGVLKQYMDLLIRPTNCLTNDGTDDHLMIRTKKAIAFASGFDKVEAYRTEKNFCDGLKGLDLYGGKVMRPKELVCIKAHRSA